MAVKPLVVLSLFDGISAGQLALQRAGIPVRRYYASEICPAAIAITQHHYPDTIQLGDIRDVHSRLFDESVDLILGGPPCQDLSQASHTKTGLWGSRSRLFFNYAQLVWALEPRWWLMENVNGMGSKNRNAISAVLGTEPVKQNAALVSAQSRRRLWWANFSWDEPEDRGILLKDILEPELGGYVDRGKSYAVVASQAVRGGTIAMYLQRRRQQIVWKNRRCHQIAVAALNGNDISRRIFDPNAKGPTVPTGKSGNTTPKVIVRGCEMRSRVFGKDGASPTITTCAKSGNVPKVEWKQDMWREMSILELERCFTLPDGYTDLDGLSATARKRCLGNSWVVDAVAAILHGVKSESRTIGAQLLLAA